MPSYTPAERARLAGALPELKTNEGKLRVVANAAGIFYEIPKFGGTRTERDQVRLIGWRDDAVEVARVEGFTNNAGAFRAAGDRAARAAWYPVADSTKSHHGFGGAFDVKILRHNEPTEDAAYKKLAQLAESEANLRAGYFFRTGPNGINDPFHFQLRTTLDNVRVAFAEFAPKVLPVLLVGLTLGALFALGGSNAG